MSSVSCLRRSFASSVNLMRCAVFGSHLRLCHHDAKDGTPSTDASNKEKKTEKVNEEESDDYTSSDEDEGVDDDSISERILTAALQFVPEFGWSTKAISEGAKVEGYSGVAEGMFSRGGGDLVLYFIEDCNLKLGDYLAETSRTEEENEKKIGQTDFIQDALEVRLRMITPYIDSWTQAMSLMLYPTSATDALQSVANMVDDIWYHSNDASTDINWYLKRGSLATIYGLTELYMVQDRSHDFHNTWRFLDRRFQDIRNTQNIKESFGNAREDISNITCSTFTLVRNITGLSKWDR